MFFLYGIYWDVRTPGMLKIKHFFGFVCVISDKLLIYFIYIDPATKMNYFC